MPLKQPRRSGCDQRILDLYLKKGWSINRIRRELQTTYWNVKKVLRSAGVAIHPRKSLAGSAHPSSKLSYEAREKLKSQLQAGRSHSGLAKEYGISRERVRQIAKEIGAPTGREIQKQQRRERRKEEEEQRLSRISQQEEDRYRRYAPWREMWRQGLRMKEMAKKLGLKENSVGVRITTLRREFPDWFPLRRKSQKWRLTDDEHGQESGAA